MTVIHAKRQDGSPALAGDRVFLVLDNGNKHCGRISQLYKPMKFHTMGFVTLQTYHVRCDDGTVRPVHAWTIKKIFDKSPKKKAATAA